MLIATAATMEEKLSLDHENLSIQETSFKVRNKILGEQKNNVSYSGTQLDYRASREQILESALC